MDGNRIREDGTSNGSTEYVYLGGLLLGAYNVSVGTWMDMIYAGNQFIAEVGGTQSAQPNYRLTDHLVHPLEVAGANGFALLTSGIMYIAGGLAVGAGCLEPTPAELGTCVAGVAAAGVAWTGATIIRKSSGVHA